MAEKKLKAVDNDNIDQDTGEVVSDNETGLYLQDGLLHTSEISCEALRFIAAQGKGETLEEIAEGIKKCVLGIADGSSKAQLNIAFKFTRASDESIRCSATVTPKVPSPTKESVYFASLDGMIRRERPNPADQLEF